MDEADQPEEPDRVELLFVGAVKVFREAQEHLDPRRDAALFNVCSGLVNLTAALREELLAIRQTVNAIDSDVKSIR